MLAFFPSAAALSRLAALAPAGALRARCRQRRRAGFGEATTGRGDRGARRGPGDPRAAVSRVAADGDLQTAGEQVLIVKGGKATDAVTGQAVAGARRPTTSWSTTACAARSARARRVELVARDRDVRLAAAEELAGGADEAMLPPIQEALARASRTRDHGVARADRGDAATESGDAARAARRDSARSPIRGAQRRARCAAREALRRIRRERRGRARRGGAGTARNRRRAVARDSVAASFAGIIARQRPAARRARASRSRTA